MKSKDSEMEEMVKHLLSLTAAFGFRLPGHSGPHWGCSQTVWTPWKSARLWELVPVAELQPTHHPRPEQQQEEKNGGKKSEKEWTYCRQNDCNQSLFII